MGQRLGTTNMVQSKFNVTTGIQPQSTRFKARDFTITTNSPS